MKKRILFLILIIGFVSCKKNEDTPPKDDALIVGIWKRDYRFENFYYKGKRTRGDKIVQNQYYIFRKDGIVVDSVIRFPGRNEEYGYSLQARGSKYFVSFSSSDVPEMEVLKLDRDSLTLQAVTSWNFPNAPFDTIITQLHYSRYKTLN